MLAVANSSEPATFANTIEGLERAGKRLNRVGAIFGVMTANMTTPEYQALQREWGPRLAAAFDEIYLNADLFARVRSVHEARATSGLNAQQQRLATRYYENFVRRGAQLNPEQKQQLSQYNQELARLFAAFNEKLLADEQTFTVATEAEMAGVPADVRNAAAAAARARNLPAGQFAI
ncbi:MAG: M3 family metallopeptidase, partial [Sphingosinicella sp.]